MPRWPLACQSTTRFPLSARPRPAQYLPPRLLHGLLPSALLERHDFYQDLTQPRLLRGYPVVPEEEEAEAELSKDDDDAEARHAKKQAAARHRQLPQRRDKYPHTIKVELKTLPADHALCEAHLGCRTFAHVVRKLPTGVVGDDLVLLSLLDAPEGSQLHSIAGTLSAVEPLSHVCRPNQTKPNRTKPNQTEPNRTKPNQTEPNRTKPNQAPSAGTRVGQALDARGGTLGGGRLQPSRRRPRRRPHRAAAP